MMRAVETPDELTLKNENALASQGAFARRRIVAGDF